MTVQPLKPHQQVCIERGLKNNHAFFLEMGLGKTRVCLEMMSREPSLNIVVGGTTARDIWQEQVTTWRPDIKVKSTIGLTKPKRMQERQETLELARKYPTILIANYEQAKELAGWAGGKDVDILVADESTYIKNHKAQRTKGMLNLAHFARRKYILTGTPVLQGPLDLYSQLNFIDKKIFPENFYAFRARYAVMGGYENKQIVGYKNLDHLMKRIQPHVTVYKKSDVAKDLPPKIPMKIYVELSGKERKAYDNVKENAVMELSKSEFVPLTNALAKLAKLMQASSGFNYYEDVMSREALEHGNTKRKVVVDLLTGDLSGRPVIIWSVFKHEIERLTFDLRQAKISVASEMTHGHHIKAAQAFKNGEADVLVGNPASLSHGLNLQRASTEIFVSNNFKFGDREQAEDRCHRIGITEPVTIIDIIAKDTIDERLLNVLAKKKGLADLVTEELKVNTSHELNMNETERSLF